MNYATLKRRKLGREGVQKLKHACDYLIKTYCQKIPEAVNAVGMLNPFGFRPYWPDENDRMATVKLMALRMSVESTEVYARTEK